MNRLAWAFWAAQLEEVFETAEGMMDINRMLDTFESTKKVKFAKGFNPDVQCIRLAFDPVIASHRPLVYYAVSDKMIQQGYTFGGFAVRRDTM